MLKNMNKSKAKINLSPMKKAETLSDNDKSNQVTLNESDM